MKPDRPGQRPRPVAWLIAGSLLGFILASGAGCVFRLPPECEVQEQDQPIPSPDGALVVQLIQRSCTKGLFLTELPASVVVWRAAAPQDRREVAGWEAAARRDPWPEVTWRGTDALHVQISNPWGAWIRPTPFAGLDVTVSVPAPASDGRR